MIRQLVSKETLKESVLTAVSPTKIIGQDDGNSSCRKILYFSASVTVQ